jgi:hypothetical protein
MPHGEAQGVLDGTLRADRVAEKDLDHFDFGRAHRGTGMLESAGELRAHGARIARQAPRDVVGRQPFVERRRDHFAVAHRQQRDRTPHLLAQLRVRGRRFWPRRRISWHRRTVGRRAPPPRLLGLAHQDAHQPRQHARLRVEGLSPLHRDHERLLHHVFRRVRREIARQAQQRGRRAVEHEGQRARIARRAVAPERSVDAAHHATLREVWRASHAFGESDDESRGGHQRREDVTIDPLNQSACVGGSRSGPYHRLDAR